MRSRVSRPSVQPIEEKVQKEIEKIVDTRLREAHITREDFSELKQIVSELARAQKELAEAQQRTEQRIAELAEAQKHTEQRVDRLEATVQELIEAQQRTEQRIAELAEAQKRTEQRVDRLEATVQELIEAQQRTDQRITLVLQRMTEEIAAIVRQLTKVEERLGRMIERELEREYREKAYAYLGQVLRNIQIVSVQDLEADLESRLSEAELDDLRLLDVLLRGKPRQAVAVAEIWLALEISAVVDRIDVERAQRRAALLRKAGYRAVPGVAGEETTQGGEEAARTECVVLLQDGRRQYWEEALARVLTNEA